MPGVLSGLNHSLEIQACGRTRRSRSFNSSWRASRQSSSQVPSTLTLRSRRRSLEQLLVGQGGPGKFLCRHEISNPDSDLDPYNGVMRRMQRDPPHASRR